jgi:urea carboxylase
MFEARRQAAFADELARWKRDGQLTYQQDDNSAVDIEESALPEGIAVIDSPVSGTVWKLLVATGEQVAAGDTVMILESMKMEIEVQATQTGCVERIITQQGHPVTAGQTLLWLRAGES